MRRARTVPVMLVAALFATAATAAETPPSEAPPPADAAELAREFADPLTAVPQFFLQDVYTPQSFGTAAQANRLVARVLVPRVPRFGLFPLPQLVRPSFSLVTVPTGRGKGTRTEFGDVQLFDLAVLPGPGRAQGLVLGVGPTLVFPTATHPLAGQRAWQIGPAFGAIYKGIPGVLLGVLVQNPISFAYTSSRARPVSTLLVQPIALRYLGHGFYVKSADATWSHSWYDGGPTLLPLSVGVGWIWLRTDRAPINLFVSGEWMAWRRDAPVAPQASARFGVTVAFPELAAW